jgi:adenylate cyclase
MKIPFIAKLTKKTFILIPAIAATVFSGLYLMQFYGDLEYRIFDGFLGMRPEPKQSTLIKLVDVDNGAIDLVGSWPWPRDVMAEGVMRMRELGARTVSFDIEYVNQSNAGIDVDQLKNKLPADFTQGFGEIQGNVNDLIDAVATGAISPKAALRYKNDLNAGIDDTRVKLIGEVSSVARDNDRYLGGALRLFGSAYVTVNVSNNESEAVTTIKPSKETERFAVDRIKADRDSALEATIMSATIPQIAEGAKGAGFVNVLIDHDGVRRRIDILREYDGKYYAQLIVAPLLSVLGNPPIEATKSTVTLKGAHLPDGTVKDIRIPISSGAQTLINWPRADFYGSFQHKSFSELVNLKRLEEDLSGYLRNIAEMDIDTGTQGRPYRDGALAVLALEDKASALKAQAMATGDQKATDAWIAGRVEYLAAAKKFLAGGSDKELTGYIDMAIRKGAVRPADVDGAREVIATVDKLYTQARESLQTLSDKRAMLSSFLAGSMCIIGWTSTGTTDLGVNPFHAQYINVGTHAALANTILQGDFLSEAPVWISIVLSFALAFLIILIQRNLKPLQNILAGIVAMILVVIGTFVLFRFTGIYIKVLGPALTVFFTGMTNAIVKYLSTEREKSFYRKAFATYLSPDVINQLVADPSKLRLGGDMKHMTAMFTDVRAFSSVSEKLTADRLVALLNEYLTGMSDIILDMRGTIDKYEGDAIIGFFGAPLEIPDHAHLALEAAVKMKRREAVMNEHFVADGMSPNPLLTRIGINTGDIVVGNMGTERKMDYTIMGNNVNLAARLEGVNKMYGTWILASDATKSEGEEGMLFRRLDRVRVVNINTPVQLWEVVDILADADDATKAKIAEFHQILDVFETKDWNRAKAGFEDFLKRWPEDGPAKTFQKRTETYLGPNPPPEGWDGVFNLNEK